MDLSLHHNPFGDTAFQDGHDHSQTLPEVPALVCSYQPVQGVLLPCGVMDWSMSF